MLEEYAATFGMLASTAIDMPAADDRHLGFGQAYEHVSLKFGSYTTSTRAIASADVVIDATPLGMKKGDPAPFDVDLISSDQVIIDVVYGHGETALVSRSTFGGRDRLRRRRHAGRAGGGHGGHRVRHRGG